MRKFIGHIIAWFLEPVEAERESEMQACVDWFAERTRTTAAMTAHLQEF